MSCIFYYKQQTTNKAVKNNFFSVQEREREVGNGFSGNSQNLTEISQDFVHLCANFEIKKF